MQTVYIETSIISYLTARPSRDVVGVARQQLTQQWWETQSSLFDLVVSPLVGDEASRGDPEAAFRRLQIIKGLRQIHPTTEVRAFTKRIRTLCQQDGYGFPEICTPEELMGDLSNG